MAQSLPSDGSPAAASGRMSFAVAFRQILDTGWPEVISVFDARTLVRRWVEELEQHARVHTHPNRQVGLQMDSALHVLRQTTAGVLRVVQAETGPQAPRRRGVLEDVAANLGISRGHDSPRAEPSAGTATVTVSLSALRHVVLACCEELDKLLAAAEPPPPERVTRPWAEDKELVTLLQDLLAVRQTGHEAKLLPRVDSLAEQLAARHEIDVYTHYTDDTGGCFELVGRDAPPSDDRAAMTIRVVRPALVYHEQLIAPGEAVEEPAEPDRTEPTAEAPSSRPRPRPRPHGGGDEQ